MNLSLKMHTLIYGLDRFMDVSFVIHTDCTRTNAKFIFLQQRANYEKSDLVQMHYFSIQAFTISGALLSDVTKTVGSKRLISGVKQCFVIVCSKSSEYHFVLSKLKGVVKKTKDRVRTFRAL